MGDDRRSGRVGVKGPLTTLWDVLKERLAKLIDELGVTKERNVVLENVRQKAVAADRAGRPKSRDIDAQSKYLRKLCATAVLEHRETTEGLLSMCRAGDFEATKAVFWCCWEDHDDVVERCGAAAVSGEVLRRSVYDLHQQLGDSLRPYRKRTASEVRGLVRALTKANALDELERSGRIKRNRPNNGPATAVGEAAKRGGGGDGQARALPKAKYVKRIDCCFDDLLSEQRDLRVSSRDRRDLMGEIQARQRVREDRRLLFEEDGDGLESAELRGTSGDCCGVKPEQSTSPDIIRSLGSARGDGEDAAYVALLQQALMRMPKRSQEVLRMRAEHPAWSRRDRLEALGLQGEINSDGFRLLEKRSLDSLLRALMALLNAFDAGGPGESNRRIRMRRHRIERHVAERKAEQERKEEGRTGKGG